MTDKSDHVRAFVAMPLPDFLKRFLADVQSELKAAGMTAAWPNPEHGCFSEYQKTGSPQRSDSFDPPI